MTGLYAFKSIDITAMQANTNYVIRVDGYDVVFFYTKKNTFFSCFFMFYIYNL